MPQALPVLQSLHVAPEVLHFLLDWLGHLLTLYHFGHDVVRELAYLSQQRVRVFPVFFDNLPHDFILELGIKR